MRMKAFSQDSGVRIVVLSMVCASALLLTIVLSMFYKQQLVFAGGSLRYDGTSFSMGLMCGMTYNLATGAYDWSSGGNTCTFSCDAAHNGQSCSVTTTIGSGVYENCTGFTTCAYYICQTDTYTCTYAAACTPDASCAASTYYDQTCTDSCGNVYQGTKPYPGCASLDHMTPYCVDWGFSCASMGMVGSWPVCVTPPTTCTADSSCAASTAVGSTCTDTCGNAYAGTMTTYAQSYYQASYAPYAQSSYYSEGGYAPSCTGATVSLTASPARVKSGHTSTLTVTGTGITTSCSITGPGVNTTVPASSCGVSQTLVTPPITSQVTYKVTCDSSVDIAKIIVNLVPKVVEF